MNPDTAKIAKVAHEANRAYCETLGDNSQPSWFDALLWQKDFAMNGVRAIFDGTVTRPEEAHENWLKEKENDGWVFGETKDPEKKTHPCMLPFSDLPEEQQAKDLLFFDIVTTLIKIP